MSEIKYLDIILKKVIFESLRPFSGNEQIEVSVTKATDWMIGSDDKSFLYSFTNFTFSLKNKSNDDLLLKGEMEYFIAIKNNFDLQNEISDSMHKHLTDATNETSVINFMKDLNDLLLKSDFPQISISYFNEIIETPPEENE